MDDRQGVGEAVIDADFVVVAGRVGVLEREEDLGRQVEPDRVDAVGVPVPGDRLERVGQLAEEEDQVRGTGRVLVLQVPQPLTKNTVKWLTEA